MSSIIGDTAVPDGNMGKMGVCVLTSARFAPDINAEAELNSLSAVYILLAEKGYPTSLLYSQSALIASGCRLLTNILLRTWYTFNHAEKTRR